MRLLITAGPTREHLDPVRFLSNGSSGRLGCALAAEAQGRGHEVTLVLGPIATPPPAGVRVVPVVSAEEMLTACLRIFPDCDAAIMTAAVADWRPVTRLAAKAPKSAQNWALELEPTRDICATLGAQKGSRILMGFALQDEDPHARAEEKLHRKQCDVIVLTSPAAIGVTEARIELKPRRTLVAPLQASKEAIARHLIDWLEMRVVQPG